MSFMPPSSNSETFSLLPSALRAKENHQMATNIVGNSDNSSNGDFVYAVLDKKLDSGYVESKFSNAVSVKIAIPTDNDADREESGRLIPFSAFLTECNRETMEQLAELRSRILNLEDHVDSIQTDLVKEQRRGNELQATTTDLKSQVDIQENEFMARLNNVQELINDSIENQLHSSESFRDRLASLMAVGGYNPILQTRSAKSVEERNGFDSKANLIRSVNSNVRSQLAEAEAILETIKKQIAFEIAGASTNQNADSDKIGCTVST
jgi:hypothetical protein